MYSYLKNMLEMSERVGRAEKVTMGPWICGSDRILIEGVTPTGYAYELHLVVRNSGEEEHGD